MQLTTGEAPHCTSPHRTSYHTTKHHITPRHTTPLRRACCPQLIRLRASSPAMVEAPSNTRSASSGCWRPLAKMLVNTCQGWPSPPKRHRESQRTFVLHVFFLFVHCSLSSDETALHPPVLVRTARASPKPLGLILGITAVVIGQFWVILYHWLHRENYFGERLPIQIEGAPTYVTLLFVCQRPCGC
jgi:hypothetical protein